VDGLRPALNAARKRICPFLSGHASESIQAFQKVAAADNTFVVSLPPGENSWQLCVSSSGAFFQFQWVISLIQSAGGLKFE